MADINVNHNEFIWAQRYRPKTLQDCILPQSVKARLQSFVDKGDIPNLLFCGSRGIGKTSVAYALMNDLGLDFYKINASMDRGIDVLRNEILQYASSVSLVSGRKFVILDEADNLTQSYQQALRAFTEEFSSNCGFIMTANYPQKIIEPLKEGRFLDVSFNYSKEEKPELLKQTIIRVLEILKLENVTADKILVKNLVVKYFPNIRAILNKLQDFSASGHIDSSVMEKDLTKFDVLIQTLKDKKFTDMRKWVADNSDVSISIIQDMVYKAMTNEIEPQSMPVLIDILNEYDYRSYFVVNKEINMVAMLTKLMSEVNWKK